MTVRRAAPARISPRSPLPRGRALAACGLAAIAGAALAAPAAAQADSIVFVKDANVWLANPDGSGQYQVTTDGTADNPYTSPSQADDGTIVTVRAKPNLAPLMRMKQNGTVLNEIPMFPMQFGPFDPAISPDGRKVAFSNVFRNAHETSSDVHMTDAAGGGEPTRYGTAGPGTGAPSWVDSDRILVASYTRVMTMTPGQQPVDWWYDWDHNAELGASEDMDDGEIASNGAIAFVRGDRDGNTIQLYSSLGPGSTVRPTCTLIGPSAGPLGQRFADPTFSPSGESLAWQEGDGIWTAKVTSAADCASAAPRLTIPGASEPDWGPAPVAPGPRETPVTRDPAPEVVPPGPVPRADPPRDGPRRPPVTRRAGARADPLKTALTRCAAAPKRRRAACVKQARRAAAIRACARRSGGKAARARCVKQAKRRFR